MCAVRHAVFEPAHGSAPDIAGQGKVNPVSMIRCGVMLLDHLGEAEAAQRVEAAVQAVYQDGKVLTADVGGSASTDEFASAVVDKL